MPLYLQRLRRFRIWIFWLGMLTLYRTNIVGISGVEHYLRSRASAGCPASVLWDRREIHLNGHYWSLQRQTELLAWSLSAVSAFQKS